MSTSSDWTPDRLPNPAGRDGGGIEMLGAAAPIDPAVVATLANEMYRAMDFVGAGQQATQITSDPRPSAGMEMPAGPSAGSMPSVDDTMRRVLAEPNFYFLDGVASVLETITLPPAKDCPSNFLDAGLTNSFPEFFPAGSWPVGMTQPHGQAAGQPRVPPGPPAPRVVGPAEAKSAAAPHAGQVSPFMRTDGVTEQARPGFDVEAVRRDFPILQERVHGKPLVWFDNAATTQKPRAVIDAIAHFYQHDNSNIHRAAHALAARATDAYEHARSVVQGFLGAASAREIVFVRGTTEAINLVAQSHGRATVGPGDEIVVTTLEHHANIVPWQMLCDEKGARLRVVPIADRGDVMIEEYARLLGPRTRIVALAHVSNTLGTIVPVEIMTRMARAVGATVLIDGAQAVAHLPVNVQAIDCDFYVLSGHKLFGPTGVGALYGRLDLLERMPPWQGGGNMIDTVTFEKTTYGPVPAKFEAGTAILAGAVGLGAAIEYLHRIGFKEAAAHEESLLHYAMAGLATVPGLRLFGTAPHKASVLSFVIDGIPNDTIGKALDAEGIAVRVGHHCAQPTMARYGVRAMVRPSLALYNTREEVDLMVRVIHALVDRQRRSA